MRKLLSVLGTLTLLFAAACTQEDVDKFLNDVMEVPATSIRFTEPSYMMTVGETLTLTVVVEPSNTTDKVEWSCLNEDVATVEDGVVTALKEGIASITAKAGDVQTGCRIIIDKAAADEGGLFISPDKVTILKNEKLQLSVTNAEGVAVKATWSSTDTMVAVVDENNMLEARNPGSAVVTATADGKTGTCEVTVTDEVAVQSIAFDPDYIEMNVGEERQLTVVFTPENATNKTINVWTVDGGNPAVSVDDSGVVKALIAGRTAVVVAAINQELIARCTIKINDPDNPDIPVESIVLDKTEATVTPNQAEPLILTATVTPADALKSKSIEWKSSNPQNVMVSRINDTQAKVVGLTADSKETVMAYIDGLSATCEVTVEKEQGGTEVSSITIDPRTLDLEVGQTAQLTATVLPESAADAMVTWSSSNPDVAYVTNDSPAGADGSVGGEGTKGGLVVARSVGTAIITASAGGKEATCQVTVGSGGSSSLERVYVDPSSVTLALDEEQTLTLVLTPSDADVTIYWESSNTSIAKVEMISRTQAKVQGIGVGRAQIIAHAGNLTAVCQVTVESSGDTVPVESVTLNKHELQLRVGEQFQFVATVLPADATEKGVVWISSVQSSKLYIDTNGLISGLQPCEATITVRCKANPYIYDTCLVTVSGGSSETEDEVVDLGLSVKWRSMNVGASKPEDYGNYYAWGETSTKSSYSWSNYKFGHSQNGSFTKYDTGVGTDNKSVLDPEDDAATVNLGDGWRTPTRKEWKELYEQCTWTWKTRNGVNGMQVTGPNGKSIFLPAGGWYDSTISNRGTYGSYWTASLAGIQGMASTLDFISSAVENTAAYARCQGKTVRPVMD